jgi:alpha/beta superfamily hydrolase
MAKTSKKQQAQPKRRQAARYDPQRGSAPPEMVDLVDPMWILKALGGVLVVALVFAFVTLSILFWRSQWQLVLHPSRTLTGTPTAAHLAFQEVHFDVDGAGHPQIDGWWIPADENAPTALMLHGANGSMADALYAAQVLHDAHLNVLLFDYRGYGKSSGQHPTQAGMQADADAALNYLTSTRSIPIGSVVLYGIGAGGPLAVHLATEYPMLPAVILESPEGDFAARAKHDPRSSLVPFSLLFDQDFALAKPLRQLKTPVLTISARDGALALQQAITAFVHAYVLNSKGAKP